MGKIIRMTFPPNVDPSEPPHDLLQDASLFLDFDGTLVEIEETPDAVRVDARLNAIICQMQSSLAGRVAVITGRPADHVRRLMDSEIAVVGSHGVEFVDRNGTRRDPERAADLDSVLAEMHRLAARHHGVLVENKPFGIALHFRQCPSAEAECVALAHTLAERYGLKLQPGKMMVEVRAAGGDKGSAIRTLMREPDMVGTRPVFMGDDLTDEPGFVAAEELGGSGILIGTPRDSAATYRLGSVQSALAWLESAAKVT
jgi:trehalose 6-phosphate phosphatase